MNAIKKILLKYNSISVQVKASLWFVVCSVLQKGIALITVPAFTRLMSPEEYGFFSTYTSWYSIILVFTSLNLFYGVFNNAMVKFEDDRNRYVASMQGLTMTITMIVFAVYLVFHNFFNSLLEMPTLLVVMLFVQLLFSPSMEFWLAENRFSYSYKKIVCVTLIKSIINPFLGIILVLSFEHKDIARILSLVLTEVFFSGIITANQFRKGKNFFNAKYWKYSLGFNLPLLPHYLSGQVLNQSDRIMISKYVGNIAVAKYSVAYSIGLLTNIFTNAINGAFTPWFYQKLKAKSYDSIKGVVLLITGIMALISVVMMLFGPEIIMIMAPKAYEDAQYAIPPVAASVLFIFLYNIFANVEFYFEKKKFVLYGSCVSAILNIVLNVVFIKLFGYIAAAYTTLACYVIYCLMHAICARYICKLKEIPSKIFPWKALLLLSLLVIIIGIGMSLLYPYTIVRYVTIAVIFVIGIVSSKWILSYLAKMGVIHKQS